VLNSEKLGNQVQFLLKKSVCDLETPIKSYRQNSERVFENVQKNAPSKPSLNFVYNFWLESPNYKRIFGDEIVLDFPTFLSSTFFEKIHSTMPKWGLKLYTIPSFHLTMSGWAQTNSNLHIPHGLVYFLPPLLYK